MLTDDTSSDEAVDAYLADVEDSLHSANLWLSTSVTLASPSSLRKLETQGRMLWNLCMKLRRDSTVNPNRSKNQKLVLHSWLLALFLFDLSRQGSAEQKIEADVAEYMLDLVLTVATASVNDAELVVARLALQRGAAFENALESAVSERENKNQKSIRCQAAYYMLRILLVRIWGKQVNPTRN